MSDIEKNNNPFNKDNDHENKNEDSGYSEDLKENENENQSENENLTWDSGSKVSEYDDVSWYLKRGFWIFIGCLLFLLLFLTLSSSKSNHDKNKNDQAFSGHVENSVSENQLSENMQKLNSLLKEPEKTQANKNNPITTTPNPTADAHGFGLLDDLGGSDGKKLLARQNAPTSMFSASGSFGGNSFGRSGQGSTQMNGSGNTNTTASTSSSNSSGSTVFAGQGEMTAFGNQSMATTSVMAQKIQHPETTIASGEFLHAVLETPIDSDLPGEVRAVVSQPVYGYVGERPLIPAGSRLIGQYSSSVMQGQNRAFVIWNRVILPNGISAQINSPGTDNLGMAGQQADDINTHFFARFGEASLLSIIGAGVSNAGVNGGDQYNSSSQYRMMIAQSYQQSANSTLANTMQIKPTLTVDQGASINVFVAHDIDFSSALKVAK